MIHRAKIKIYSRKVPLYSSLTKVFQRKSAEGLLFDVDENKKGRKQFPTLFLIKMNDYFFTTLNVDFCPFSSVTLKMYIPTSSGAMLTVAFPLTKSILLFFNTTFPVRSVTTNE